MSANPNRTKKLWSAQCMSSHCQFAVPESQGGAGTQKKVNQHLESYSDHMVTVTTRRTSYQYGRDHPNHPGRNE